MKEVFQMFAPNKTGFEGGSDLGKINEPNKEIDWFVALGEDQLDAHGDRGELTPSTVDTSSGGQSHNE